MPMLALPASFYSPPPPPTPPSFPTRRSSDLSAPPRHSTARPSPRRLRMRSRPMLKALTLAVILLASAPNAGAQTGPAASSRSEEHTSELQSRGHLVCRLLLEKKNNNKHNASV